MQEQIDARCLRYAEQHIIALLCVFSSDGPHLRTRQVLSRELWPHIAEQAIKNLLAKGLILEKDGILEISLSN